MKTIAIPLDQLMISPDNVRQAESNITDLVASIAAHGLLNPLTAIADGEGYQVIAGGRRLRALQRLEWLTAPVNVVASGDTAELSLTENMSRVAMSTLDTLHALRRITDAREDPAYIAERFGLPMDRARKIARLSCLCSEVLDHWQADQLGQAEAEAFAATADHDLQRAALKRYLETEESWSRRPQNIRNWLGMGDYEARQMLAFVGRDAYEGLGGVVETDLFGDNERVANSDLLQQLADARRTSLFDEVQAQSNRSLELIAEQPENYWQHYARPETGDLPAPDEARLVELEHLMESLDRDKQEAEWDAAEAERDKLEDTRPLIFPEGGRIGCHIDTTGAPTFYWLQRFDAAETDSAAGEAKAEPEEPSLTPSGKADMTMNDMRRERLAERSTVSTSMADAAQELLLFTVARTCFGQAYEYATAGMNKISDPALAERVTFITMADEAKAWSAFRKAFNTEAKRGKLAAEIVARMTAPTAKPDHPHIALLTRYSQPVAWQSTEAFWQLWRKGQMLELAQEFDPHGHVTGKISGITQGEMRRVLHDLFTSGKCWPGLDAETAAAVQAWVPQWLRFTDEQSAAPELAEAA